MGTRILVLVLIINVIKMSYLQPCQESALHTSITVKSNARIGEVVFTVPDNSSNTQLMTDITLCKISKYFKVASKGRGEISVKSCLPDDYTENLHLCSDNDGICRGILRLTVIPFWRKPFMTVKLKVMMTDFKTDNVIDVNEGSSLGKCAQFPPVCTVVCTNSDKIFWISSGNSHVLTYAYGIIDRFLYKLTVTCPAQSKLNEFYWMSYNRLNIRAMFVLKHEVQATSPVVPTMNYLQEIHSIASLNQYTKSDSDGYFRSLLLRKISNDILVAYFESNIIRDTLYKSKKRRSFACKEQRRKRGFTGADCDLNLTVTSTTPIPTTTLSTITNSINTTSTRLSSKPTITSTTSTMKSTTITPSIRTTSMTTIITSTITRTITTTTVNKPTISTVASTSPTVALNLNFRSTTISAISTTQNITPITETTFSTIITAVALNNTLVDTSPEPVMTTVTSITSLLTIAAVTQPLLPTTVSTQFSKSKTTSQTAKVTFTPTLLTASVSATTSSSVTSTTMTQSIDSTILLPSEELVGSSTFLDEPVNIVFIATGTLLIAFLFTIGILCCLYTKKAQKEKKRNLDGRSSNSSDASSREGEGSNRRARSMSLIIFPSTASDSSLTPIEMV